MPELRLRPAAERDLQGIWETGLAEWGPAQAAAYLDRLLDTLELIGAFPDMARLRAEIAPPVRIHPHASHLVIYEVAGNAVEVIRVLHARQDWAAFLSD